MARTVPAMNIATPAAALTALLLAGCGGGADAAESRTLEQLAADIGCTKVDDGGEQALTRESGSCKLDGEDIYLQTFADGDQQDEWRAMADAAGGVFVVGDQWVVQTFDQETADAVAAKVGGEVD